LALVAAALLWPALTVGDVISGEPVMSASAEITPIKLPRSNPAPARLRLGFTSEALDGSATPELSRVEIDLGPSLQLHTTGLPSCSFAQIYSVAESPGHSCAKSLVGKGTVDSEIDLPGRSPAKVEGQLSAFYVARKEESLILARVITGEPMPLIYVIPFKITRRPGAFGTGLLVRRMHVIQGICIHPHCFSPYTLKGVYSRISKLELSLHRRFADAGRSDSFISAQCPAPGKRREATFPITKVSLDYASGQSLAATVERRCRTLPE
jgi:hypothetical protein